MIVNIDSVVTNRVPTRREILKMVDVLRRQGQIEPLQVRAVGDAKLLLGHPLWVTFDQDVHAAAIVAAARSMKWFTLLVVEMKVYEQ